MVRGRNPGAEENEDSADVSGPPVLMLFVDQTDLFQVLDGGAL